MSLKAIYRSVGTKVHSWKQVFESHTHLLHNKMVKNAITEINRVQSVNKMPQEDI